MRRRGADTEVQRRLRATTLPDAARSEDRAWRVVRAAHAEATPPPRRAVFSVGARVVLVATLALVAGLALTSAGGAVSRFLEDVVAPGVDPAKPSLRALPVDERLLVQSRSGAWIVQPDGARRRLGRWSAVTWSPGGLFVAAARDRELAALDPRGTVRWSVIAPARIADPRWSPDGYRVAYRSGDDLRVVAGDGTGDRGVARDVAPTAPAWRPGRPAGAQELAFAQGPHIRIVAVDGGRTLSAARAGRTPRELSWTPDGQRLIGVSKDRIEVMGPRARPLFSLSPAKGLRFEGSALAPDGRRLAVLAPRQDGLSTELLIARMDRRPHGHAMRRSFVGPGFYDSLSWSTDGRVLALASIGTDRWLFVHRDGKIGAVRGTSGRFGPDARPAGWCYPEPASRVIQTVTSCSAASPTMR